MPKDERFFDELTGLLSLERNEAHARLKELQEQLPLDEQQARGLVLLDMEAVEESVGFGGRVLVTLEHAQKQRLTARLQPGDLVELAPRRAEVSEAAKATVVRATRFQAELAFERPPPPFVFDGRLKAALTQNDVTFDRAKQALAALKSLDKGAERRRREVYLGREAPRFDRVRPLEPTQPLNPEQRLAVERALAAEDFFLVHGPPGTGKSTVLAELAVQSVRRGERLLCVAASNAAVDHLLELCVDNGLEALRVGHPARVLPHLQAHTLDIRLEEHPDRVIARRLFDEAFGLLGYARKQRSQGRSRERFANARQSQAEAYQRMDEARALERKALSALLQNAQVLCATLAGAAGHPLVGEKFDRVLLDEATQAIEPLAAIAFLKAPKVVLAGDPQQLPPTVLSKSAAERGLAKSLFERLLEEHGEDVKQLLREQYRMNVDIMSFPSREMYGGELRAHESVARRTLSEVLEDRAIDAPPVLFLDTAGKGFDETSPDEASLENEGEAELVVQRAHELLRAGLDPRELAVIAPYRAQASRIRERLTDEAVEVDTVDGFQGREKDAVLVSLTRSNREGAVGFLSDLRRMNVAMTRARRHLFVVGDSATLSAHPFYARFIESTQSSGGYRSAWEWS